MDKPRVLVVFKAEDLPHMETLLSWDTNKEYDFVYETTLPRTGIHTPDGKALKEELKAKIKTMTHLLCIIGKQTADNDWINFQIQQASVSGRKVIAVRLDFGLQKSQYAAQLRRDLGEGLHLRCDQDRDRSWHIFQPADRGHARGSARSRRIRLADSYPSPGRGRCHAKHDGWGSCRA